MNDVVKVSRRMRRLFLFLAFAIPLARAIGWMNYEPALPHTWLEFGPGLQVNWNGLFAQLVLGQDPLDASHPVPGLLTFWQHVAAAGASALPTALSIFLLIMLARLFGLYEAGEFFSAAVVAAIRRIGWLLMAMALFAPIYSALCCMILLWHPGPGTRLCFATDAGDAAMAITGAIVLVMAHVMDQARRLQEDADLTV
ncbi:MAG TPA: DUF2975 domain-containing protein [Burkholderiaceae bacterium]